MTSRERRYCGRTVVTAFLCGALTGLALIVLLRKPAVPVPARLSVQQKLEQRVVELVIPQTSLEQAVAEVAKVTGIPIHVDRPPLLSHGVDPRQEVVRLRSRNLRAADVIQALVEQISSKGFTPGW